MTYDDVARHFGLKRCGGCLSRYDHKAGALVGDTIHWSDRRFSRPGLRNFLMLVGQEILHWQGSFLLTEKWRRIWLTNVWAARVARKELHITIPTRYSAADRAFVWWHIQGQGNVPAAARAWAKPKGGTHGH